MTRYTTQCESCGEEIRAYIDFDFFQITQTDEHTIEEDFDNVKKNIVCQCGHETTVQLEAIIRVKERKLQAIRPDEGLSEFDRYVDNLCKKNSSAWFHKDELEAIVNGWLELQREQRKEAA